MNPLHLLPDNMQDKTTVTDSCWLWTGALNSSGYASVWDRDMKKVRGGHRVAYESVIGPIPNGLTIDHWCRVRHCVNPRHLQPMTNAENVRRGNGGMWARSKTHCPHGHEYTDVNTATYRGKRSCNICNRRRTAEHKQRHDVVS